MCDRHNTCYVTFINKNNLEVCLSATYRILDVIRKTLMRTYTCERYFSMMKRKKIAEGQRRGNRLETLSIEKE